MYHRFAPYHDSPNAGYPISAMALALGVKLGGDTAYFGEIKRKAYFGDGREIIQTKDIQKALTLQPRLDMIIVILLGVLSL